MKSSSALHLRRLAGTAGPDRRVMIWAVWGAHRPRPVSFPEIASQFFTMGVVIGSHRRYLPPPQRYVIVNVMALIFTGRGE